MPLNSELRGYNLEATLNSLNHFVNPLASLAHRRAPDCVTLSHYSVRPIVTLISLSLIIFGPIALFYLCMAMSGLKDTAIVLTSFPMTLNPYV
jgi:hypothetical protein